MQEEQQTNMAALGNGRRPPSPNDGSVVMGADSFHHQTPDVPALSSLVDAEIGRKVEMETEGEEDGGGGGCCRWSQCCSRKRKRRRKKRKTSIFTFRTQVRSACN